MHRLLRGYDVIPKEEFEALASTALIVPDANVLLHFYRLSEDARNDLFRVLRWAQNRLWVPFTVALEFSRNRQATRAKPIKQLETAAAQLATAMDSIKTQLDSIHPRDSRDVLQHVLQSIEENRQKFETEVKSIAKRNSPGSPDIVRDTLEGILLGHVSDPLSSEEIKKALEEASQRYGAKIPPGYKDADKKDFIRFGPLEYDAKYGDFLIWHEIRHRMRDAKERSLIFLSNDQKEDWWQEDNGKIIGPRPELHAELVHYSNIETFTIYTVERFLQLVKDCNLIPVAANTISEVADAVVHAEQPKEDQIPKSIVQVLNYLSKRKAEEDAGRSWQQALSGWLSSEAEKRRRSSIMQMFRDNLSSFGGPTVHLDLDRHGNCVASLSVPNEQGKPPISHEISVSPEQARELRELGAIWDGPLAYDPGLK